MQFLPRLRDFLKQHGAIYTVRSFAYRTKETYVEGVGRCKRTLIRRVVVEGELSDYVEQSGFTSVGEWWNAIRTFVPAGTDMYLFKVVVKR